MFCGATNYLSLATAAFFGLGAYVTTWSFGRDAALRRGRAARRAARRRVRRADRRRGAAPARRVFRGDHLRPGRAGATRRHLLREGLPGHGRARHRRAAGSRRPSITRCSIIAVRAAVTALAVRRKPPRARAARHRRRRGARADARREHAARQDRSAFALSAFFAGALGAAMAMRWTYIDPPTVFNPFIGFQTVLIAMVGGAHTIIGPIALVGGVQPAHRVPAAAVPVPVPDPARAAADPAGALSARRARVADWPLALARLVGSARAWHGGSGGVVAEPLLAARRHRALRRTRRRRRRRARASAGRARRRDRAERRGQDDLLPYALGRARADRGPHRVAGTDLTGRPAHVYALHGVARTFQTPRVFREMTADQNVRFGLEFAGRTRSHAHDAFDEPRSILDFLGLAEVAHAAGRRAHAVAAAAARDRHGARRATARAAARRGRGGAHEAEVEATAQLIRRVRDELGLAVIWIEHAVRALHELRGARRGAAPGPQDRRRDCRSRWRRTRRWSRPILARGGRVSASPVRARAVRRLRRDPGARRDRSRGARGRAHRGRRAERRGQDDAAAGALGPDPAPGRGAVRRRAAARAAVGDRARAGSRRCRRAGNCFRR